MRAQDQTPPSRLIAFAALLLAVTLLSLRGYDLFNTPQSDPIGSTVERELTYLLEPVTGADRVRVAVTGRTDRTVLVMIDGEMASDLRPLRTQVENILIAAIEFDPETETLTLTQFPFAHGVGSALTPLQMAELTALGLLSLMLLVNLVAPLRLAPSQPSPPAPQPTVSPTPTAGRLPPPTDDSADMRTAAQLAESNPNETARLVRNWMSYAEE